MVKPINYENILRRVDDEKAFYFYQDVNMYTGIKVNSLEDFANTLPTLAVEVIDFHLKRGDFEKWIKEVLGDETLSNNILKIREKGLVGEEAKKQLIRVVSRRLRELRKKVIGKI
jgi:hypothetical protein